MNFRNQATNDRKSWWSVLEKSIERHERNIQSFWWKCLVWNWWIIHIREDSSCDRLDLYSTIQWENVWESLIPKIEKLWWEMIDVEMREDWLVLKYDYYYDFRYLFSKNNRNDTQ